MDFCAQAISYARVIGVDVINCSWGSSYTQDLRDAVNNAINAGIIIVKSAGNDNNETADYLNSRGDCISVAATDINDVKGSFSNYGSWVDLSAPGVSIRSTYFNNTYSYLNGTSQAAPHVTGLIGLIKTAQSVLNPAQIITTMSLSCDNISGSNPGYLGKLGSGRINANRAVRSLYVPQVYSTIQEALSVAQTGQNVVVASGSYSVTTDLTVPNGITLSVNSGATLTFSAGKKLTVNGRIYADGVTFTDLNDAYWKGIKLINADNESFIKNCNIFGFGTGIGSDGIYIEGCSPLIEYNYFDGGQYNAIKIYAASPTIRNNTISWCTAGNGITVENNSSPEIYDNVIGFNYYHGISIYNCTDGYPHIFRNTLSNNGYPSHQYHGIRAYGSLADVYYNQINNCSFGFYSESNSTIDCTTGPLLGKNNLVEYCRFGWVASTGSEIIGGEGFDPYYGDYNSIRNIEYNILHASQSSTIDAMHNYLGSDDYSTISSKVYVESGSTVNWYSYLNDDEDPWRFGEKAVTSNVALSLKKETTSDENNSLMQVRVLIKNEKYFEAKQILKDLIKNRSSKRAIMPLLNLFYKSKDVEVRTFLEELVLNTKDSELENIYSGALVKLYFNTRDYNLAGNLIENRISKGIKEAKVDKFLLHALCLRDNAKALAILEEIRSEISYNSAEELYTLLLPETKDQGINSPLGSVLSSQKEESKIYDYALEQNYPNPFNPTTTISFSLPEEGKVALKIYDIMGREVITLADGIKSAGNHRAVWEGKNSYGTEVASGIYFYKISFRDQSFTKKMLLVR